jgi:hypothetical protein
MFLLLEWLLRIRFLKITQCEFKRRFIKKNSLVVLVFSNR